MTQEDDTLRGLRQDRRRQVGTALRRLRQILPPLRRLAVQPILRKIGSAANAGTRVTAPATRTKSILGAASVSGGGGGTDDDDDDDDDDEEEHRPHLWVVVLVHEFSQRQVPPKPFAGISLQLA